MMLNRILFAFLVMSVIFTALNAGAADKPTLFIVSPARGDPNMFPADDVNYPALSQKYLVIATHGWFEREPWPANLAMAIRDNVDPNLWLCGWLDWRKNARFINPRNAAQYARDTAGPLLAEQILKLADAPCHIHLIAHSAGCWTISEAAQIIAEKTRANIHLTFLDAYIPIGWDANGLGNIPADPNRIYWADQYLTQDATLQVTNRPLLHAHNVDIGDVTPGLKDHEFPRYWYPATARGSFPVNDIYAGKKLYTKTENLEYGFARSLEAGRDAWLVSIALPCGNKPVKIHISNNSGTE